MQKTTKGECKKRKKIQNKTKEKQNSIFCNIFRLKMFSF